MEAVQAIKPDTNKKHSLSINEAMISGQVQNVRKIKTQEGTLYLTLLRLPAANEFAHPSTVELRSYDPIGDKDEVITVKVRVAGIPNTYESKTVDRTTGEQITTTVRSARNELPVIAD